MPDLAQIRSNTQPALDWESAVIPANVVTDLMIVHVKTAHDRVLPLEALGFANPRSISMAGPVECLWLGPGEWLLLAPTKHCHELTSFAQAARGAVIADAQSRLLVVGLDSDADLLAGLTGLPSETMAPGLVARTRLADIPVTIAASFNGRIRLLFERPYSLHVRAWLDLAI